MKWPDGRIFEGTFTAGNPVSGKVRFGKTEYEGPVNSSGKPSGQGKLIEENGTVYEGCFLDGNRHKAGTFVTPDGKPH